MKKLLLLSSILLSSSCFSHTPGNDYDEAELYCFIGEHEYCFREETTNADEADFGGHVYVSVYGDKYYFKQMIHMHDCEYCENYEQKYKGK